MEIQSKDIVYEDNHLIALNKPAGVLIQGDQTGDEPMVDSVKNYLKQKYKKPGAVFLGVVHRLDRPVSGIVVFARTSKSLERMNALFRNRKTEKMYWAIVEQKPPASSDKLVHWLLKNETKNKVTAFKQETSGTMRCELSYKTLGNIQGRWLMEVHPITGRSHQIRVQLATLGCSIVGDVKYGAGSPNPDKSICLHARALKFVHPVQLKLMDFTAPLPQTDIWQPFHRFLS